MGYKTDYPEKFQPNQSDELDNHSSPEPVSPNADQKNYFSSIKTERIHTNTYAKEIEIPVITVDAGLKIHDMNAPAILSFGKGKKNTGKPVSNILVALGIENLESVLRDTLIDRQNREFEFQTVDEEEYILHIHPLAAHEQPPNSLILIFIKKQFLKPKEIQLREDGFLYKLLTEYAQDIIYRYRFHPERQFEYISPIVEYHTGYTQNEIYNDPNLFIKITDKQTHKKALRLFQKGTKPYEGILLRLRKKHGGYIWTEHRSVPIFDSEGRLIAIQGIARDVTLKKQFEEEINIYHDQLHKLSEHLEKIRTMERERLAAKIHDEIAQSLIGLHYQLDWFFSKLQPEEKVLKRKAKYISAILSETLETVEKLNTQLHSSILDDLGLKKAMSWHLKEYQEVTGLNYQLEFSPKNIDINQNISMELYRIFQEVLINTVRHARANLIKVSMKKKSHNLELQINDDGIGITRDAFESDKSFGLKSIEERVKKIGGSVRIFSEKNKGTKITVVVPLGNQGENL